MHGDIYVCDQMNDRVQVFDAETGHYRRTFGSRGKRLGQFKLPHGLATCGELTQPPPGCNFGPNRDSKVVVADTGNHRVQVFSSMGDTLHCIEQIDSPTGIEIHPETGHILICSAGSRTIHIVDRCCHNIHQFGHQFKEKDQFKRPVSVALAKTRPIRLWVLDSIRAEWCELSSLYNQDQGWVGKLSK